MIRFTVLLFLPLMAFAQGAGTQVELAFTAFALGDAPSWKNLYYVEGGQKEPIKLTFRNNGRSTPIKVTGTGKPLVFALEQVDPNSQKKQYLPVAEVQWPAANVTKALLVFATAPGLPEAKAVRVMALDDGLEAHPLRSVRVFNASGQSLLAKIGNYEGTLPIGVSDSKAYPVKSDNATQVGSYPLAFAVTDAEKGPRIFYNGYGEAWPQGRTLVFVLAPKQAGTAAQVKVLVDAPVVPKK